MNDTLKEHMSALFDGELEPRSASETIDILLKDDELLVHWSRYHTARDVLRHKVYPDAAGVLRDRVRSCLDGEPMHFPVRRPVSQRWRQALKPVAGLALAASVAVVAILAVRGPGQVPGPAETAQAPSAQPSTVAPSTRVAAYSGSGIVPASATGEAEFRPKKLKRLQWSTPEPGVVNRLNAYLVSHSEHLGGSISGMHPYARVVGYDSTGQR
jgi:sigma-E factor negative regulatory protein RseA